jgi:hypothetical protein
MSFKLSRRRPTKGGIQARLWGALENDFSRNLLLAAALLVGILALVDAAWARGRPQPPPREPVPDSPPARYGHGFTSNGGITSADSKLYLFGGDPTIGAPSDLLNDLWYYQADSQKKWTLVPVGNNKPPGLSSMGWACGGGRCVSATGIRDGKGTSETWIFTESAGSWSKVDCKRASCPSARFSSVLAWDPNNEEFVLFGGAQDCYRGGNKGCGRTTYSDTYTLSGTTWIAESSGTVPPAREQAAAAYVPGRGVVLFGGAISDDSTASFVPLCDMYIWDGGSWTAIAQTQGPCLRNADMVWEPDSGAPGAGRIAVVGGYSSSGSNNDVWYFAFGGVDSGTWTKGSPLACTSGVIPVAARMAREQTVTGKKVFFGGILPDTDTVTDATIVCY